MSWKYYKWHHSSSGGSLVTHLESSAKATFHIAVHLWSGASPPLQSSCFFLWLLFLQYHFSNLGRLWVGDFSLFSDFDSLIRRKF